MCKIFCFMTLVLLIIFGSTALFNRNTTPWHLGCYGTGCFLSSAAWFLQKPKLRMDWIGGVHIRDRI